MRAREVHKGVGKESGGNVSFSLLDPLFRETLLESKKVGASLSKRSAPVMEGRRRPRVQDV